MVSRIGDILPQRPSTLVPATLPPATLPAAAPKLKLLPLKANITLPPRLGRPPTTADLIITRTFDGLTPAAAAKQINGRFKGTIAPQNKTLVSTTVDARVRDMQVALNNVFTKGTPNRQFLDGQQPAAITVLGSMSSSNAIVYQVTKPKQEPKYYTRAWSGGGFVETTAPKQVVMEARLSLEPPALRMNYPSWKNASLAGQISTITEL
ncbi:MAG: hypothetical protein Q8K32_31565 [Archangium sp.]|nr:hypothetical protein [Archangium sp.]